MNGTKFCVNDTYILKKDLPTIRKGTEFIIKDDMHGQLYILAVNQISFPLRGFDNFYDWFEKKEEKLWKPIIPCTTIYIKIVNEGGRLEKSFNADELKHIRFFEKLLEEHKEITG